jgi:hypothetical protein
VEFKVIVAGAIATATSIKQSAVEVAPSKITFSEPSGAAADDQLASSLQTPVPLPLVHLFCAYEYDKLKLNINSRRALNVNDDFIL